MNGESYNQEQENEAKEYWGPEMWAALEAQHQSPTITPEKHLIEKAIEAPTEPEAFHAWVISELGDSELAGKVELHPELTVQILTGEGTPSADFFGMLQAIGNDNPQLARKLARIGVDSGSLLQLNYDQIVGDASELKKKDVLLDRSFIATKFAATPLLNEVQKTPEQKMMIEYVADKVNELRALYHQDKFAISPEQVRFIGEQFLGEADVTGKVSTFEQSIKLGVEQEGYQMLNKIFHEMIHFGGYVSVQLDEVPNEKTFELSGYRIGLTVVSRGSGRKQVYLKGLNEAVTEELANRMFAQIPEEHPVFGPLVQKADRLSTKLIADNQDAYEKSGLREHWIKPVRSSEGKLIPEVSYGHERFIMFNLFKKIHERTVRCDIQTLEETEEEIFEMLTKAVFTGNILPFGRLFNEVFGRGKFREFGHLQTTGEQQAFVTSL